MKRMSKIGNNGFSLVELVIVMAIMVIIAGAAFTSISLLTSRPVDECAKKIQIALEGNRNTTMGKFSSKLEFTADSDGIWVEEWINNVSEGKIKIGQSGLTVKYITHDNGVSNPKEYNLATTPVTIVFDRADGSLQAHSQTSGGVNVYVTSFVVSKGNARTLTVNVDRLTGRVGVE